MDDGDTYLCRRFTFQIAFWDALKTLDEGAARRAGSLARLMAHLVIRKQMSLTVLKVRGECVHVFWRMRRDWPLAVNFVCPVFP